MDTADLIQAQKERMEDLRNIIDTYRSTQRKSKGILIVIMVICIFALYFMLSNLFDGIWGYILTIAIVFLGYFCIDKLGISFKRFPASDGKLAYHACVAMEALIKIKKGTYCEFGVNIVCVSEGKHANLYMEFIQLYPNLACKELKKLANIQVTNEDIFE